jgi:hypothetical protein
MVCTLHKMIENEFVFTPSYFVVSVAVTVFFSLCLLLILWLCQNLKAFVRTSDQAVVMLHFSNNPKKDSGLRPIKASKSL